MDAEEDDKDEDEDELEDVVESAHRAVVMRRSMSSALINVFITRFYSILLFYYILLL